MDQQTVVIILLGLVIVFQMVVLFGGFGRENFKHKCLTGNCDEDLWPVYHREGVSPEDKTWSCQSPKMKKVNTEMSCGTAVGSVPVGVESKLTAAYDKDPPQGAIYDNILDIPDKYQTGVYLSPSSSNNLIKPTCDCSHDISKYSYVN